MKTSYQMGEVSQSFHDWCVRNYGAKDKLRIEASWVDCNAENTRFYVNNTEHPYTDFGTDMMMSKGTKVNVKLCGDSSAHVFSVDGVEVGYPIDFEIPEFTMDGNKTISVVFKQHFI